MANKEERWWDFPTAFFLLLALWTAVLRLKATGWTENLRLAEILVIIGCGLGLLLGQSKFRSRFVGLLAAVYSLFFIGWRLGMTMEAGILWPERILSVLGRIWASLALILQNQPVQDPMLFLTSMMVLFWGISLYGGYQLTRKGNPWAAVLIAAITFLIIDFYNPFLAHKGRYSAFFFLAVILLAGRLYFVNSRKEWRKRGIAVDSETGHGLARSMILTSAILVILAWNVPVFFEVMTPGTAARNQVVNAWSELRDWFGNVAAGLQGDTVRVNDFFGSELELGRGNPLGDQAVFTVKTSSKRATGMRYYWRGNTYDNYENGAWNNRLPLREMVDPDQWPLKYPDYAARKDVEFNFSMQASVIQTLYVPSLPLSISRPAVVVGETMNGGDLDVTSIASVTPLRAGEVFQAVSSVSVPTITRLKAAGETYPEWVTGRYLQLPEGFSPRVIQLAQDITAGLETPYDKTEAITEYLRREIEYSDVIDSPPQGQDPIEWFLFDYQKGFCNYYATSEVLMLRAVGVPARMAAGFAQGEELDQANTYRVRILDSHAWPEVFFPGYGWVEFEPTVSQPALTLLQGSNVSIGGADDLQRIDEEDRLGGMFEEDPFDSRLEELDGDVAPQAEPAQGPPNPLLVLLGVAAALAVLQGGARLTSRRQPLKAPVRIEKFVSEKGFQTPNWLKRWAQYQEMQPVERIFQMVRRLLRLQGVRITAGQTAREQVELLKELVPEVENEAEILLHEFQQEAYSPYLGNIDTAWTAQRRITKKVLRAWVKRSLRV